MKSVFIGGCGRSGTTLLGSMIGAHSKCLCSPESQFKIKALYHLDKYENKEDLLSILNFIRNHWRFKVWDINIELEEFKRKSITSYSQLIEWLVKKYGESVGNPNPSIWVDHTPSNIKYIAKLINLFPDSKLIHLVRDGRAVASSVMSLDWGPNTIIEASNWWLNNVSYGLAVESSFNNRVIHIKYEDLVSAPKKSLKEICSFLDIGYEDSMLESNGFVVPNYTNEQHSFVGQKTNTQRINAWKKELNSRQVEIFESLTGDFLSYLGYNLQYGFKAIEPTRFEKLKMKIYEICKKQFVNRVRRRVRINNKISTIV